MPAAASENTTGMFFGTDLANRRCRERRAAIGRLQVDRKMPKQKPGGGRKAGTG